MNQCFVLGRVESVESGETVRNCNERVEKVLRHSTPKWRFALWPRGPLVYRQVLLGVSPRFLPSGASLEGGVRVSLLTRTSEDRLHYS